MSFSLDDTVAAIASPPGSGIRGILRVSGPDVGQVIATLLRDDTFAYAHGDRTAKAYQVSIPLGTSGLSVEARLLYWPTRRSFTGEPLAEFHCVGSPPILEEILENICLCGARPAGRGEFTLRAFLAGRIDLVQAEAVLGVIDAADSEELKTALTQLGGGISSQIAVVREQLLLHLADLEAGLDFVEEDIDFVSRTDLLQRLDEVSSWMELLLTQASERIQSTGRHRIVLAGLPNAGKSTLFNLLAGADAALVSPTAGTTRDYLTAVVDSDGVMIDLVDTAGWETARDGIELAAAVLRNDQFMRAHLVIWCSAADQTIESTELDARLLSQCREDGIEVFRIVTKSDLNPDVPGNNDISVSAESQFGIDRLKQEIARRVSGESKKSEMIGTTAARCVESLRHAQESLTRARSLVQSANTGMTGGDELIALELRDVLDQLGRIIGEVYTDDILDRIFSRFCIGK